MTMFRISILETAIACGLFSLVILIPLIMARGYAGVHRRLNEIERKLSKKK